MEELIGLLLILVFGGIEAWNKHKKKKAEAGGKGNVGSKKKLSGRERRRERMPEAWPAVDMGGADHRPAPTPLPEPVATGRYPVEDGDSASYPVEVPTPAYEGGGAFEYTEPSSEGKGVEEYASESYGAGIPEPEGALRAEVKSEVILPGTAGVEPVPVERAGTPVGDAGSGTREGLEEGTGEIPGVDISLRQAVVASVILERKYC